MCLHFCHSPIIGETALLVAVCLGNYGSGAWLCPSGGQTKQAHGLFHQSVNRVENHEMLSTHTMVITKQEQKVSPPWGFKLKNMGKDYVSKEMRLTNDDKIQREGLSQAYGQIKKKWANVRCWESSQRDQSLVLHEIYPSLEFCFRLSCSIASKSPKKSLSPFWSINILTINPYSIDNLSALFYNLKNLITHCPDS